jgi:4-hydroxythreonine-4-phosphate dehydrogenase
MGDAAGVGPEIIVRAIADREVHEWCVPVVLGDTRVLRQAMEYTGAHVELQPIRTVAEARGEAGSIDCLDYGNIDVERLRPGVVSASNGAAAVQYTRDAARLALGGAVDAIVSAPLNKTAMHRAGFRYDGHTEIFAEEAGSSCCTMVLLLGTMRVMLFTNHMPLRQACALVTPERILDKLKLAAQALREMGIPQPRIAVAGLNPHAGEEGIFGREEREGIIPAIEAARANGIDAVGPFPADTIFLKARDGAFDMTLALYHDQGLMAAKLLGFGTVVAFDMTLALYHDQGLMAAKLLGFGTVVTLLVGLPFIRTSVGHGTAFDIAGTGRADHRNMVEAIRVAATLGARRGADSRGFATADRDGALPEAS